MLVLVRCCGELVFPVVKAAALGIEAKSLILHRDAVEVEVMIQTSEDLVGEDTGVKVSAHFGRVNFPMTPPLVGIISKSLGNDLGDLRWRDFQCHETAGDVLYSRGLEKEVVWLIDYVARARRKVLEIMVEIEICIGASFIILLVNAPQWGVEIDRDEFGHSSGLFWDADTGSLS